MFRALMIPGHELATTADCGRAPVDSSTDSTWPDQVIEVRAEPSAPSKRGWRPTTKRSLNARVHSGSLAIGIAWPS
jgi:hypothetical protein